MIGKKDNHDIFNQYRQVLVEQVISNNVIEALLNRVKSANMDKQLKYDIIDYIKRCETSFPSSKSQHGEYDADAAGYASYPDAKPAIDQDDTEAVNEQDPEFAKIVARERKKQQEENPEKAPDLDEEEPMPTEAPWWVPGEENKERWLQTQQGHWRQAQKQKQEQSRETT